MVDLAEIVRGEGARFLSTHVVTRDQYKALLDIAGCQTETMGSVLEKCRQCQLEYWLFRSCRNRSCPQCQGQARASWFAARAADILPVPYLHVVFNAPRELHKLARYCPRPVYDALIRASSQAVIDVGRSQLNARLGGQAVPDLDSGSGQASPYALRGSLRRVIRGWKQVDLLRARATPGSCSVPPFPRAGV